MIGIIAAMQAEIVDITAMMENVEKKCIHNTDFYVGTLSGKEVVVVRSGVAKVNATVSTMLLLNNFPIKYIVNIGSAGGLADGMKLLDVVVSTKVVHHDLNVTLDGQPLYAEANAMLVEKALEAASEIKDINTYSGLIASGEQFITTQEAMSIKEKYPETLAVEMEASAVGFTCWRMDIPFVVIRSVSDIPHKEGNYMTFEEFLPFAAKNAAILTRALVSKL